MLKMDIDVALSMLSLLETKSESVHCKKGRDLCMKKFWCAMLVLAMLLTCSGGLAEDFQLHSGVTFGMTVAEVVEKHTARGNTFTMVDGRLTSDKWIAVLNESGTIYYDFDQAGTVVRQQFYLKNIDMPTFAKHYTNVYGAPMCTTATDTVLTLPDGSFTGPIPSSYEFGYTYFGSMMSMMTHTKKNFQYYQWLVAVDGGYVAIEMYGYDYYCGYPGQAATTAMGNGVLIDYRFFTEEQIQDAIVDAEEEAEQFYGDI